MKPALGCGGKAEGKNSASFVAVVEQSLTFRGLQSECCLFVKLKGKPSKLFCCCETKFNI